MADTSVNFGSTVMPTREQRPKDAGPVASHGKRPVLTYALIGILVLFLLAGVWYWRTSVETYHLETVKHGVLYRDGNRGLREFKTAVRKVKPKTVVWLIDEKETVDPTKPQFAQEAEFLAQQGVTLERVPVVLGGWPTDADLQKFFAIVEDPTKRPVLFHCAQGVRRTGMFAAAYQESVLGWDKEKAKAEMLTFGHSQRTIKDVQRFIDHYDPKSRTMTAKLEQSEE